ncbi:MAG: DUF5906 domain-containing protein [Proteobacteria bacterium]|nr:DUF5906 domain-containing protein [Pseudomonadota bacterium]
MQDDKLGWIILPLIRYDRGELVGSQKIAPEKFKDGNDKFFNGGMEKKGAACRLGDEPINGDLILIAEGYATAATGREATDYALPVFMALDSGNLLHVARILRAKYPNSPFLFLADDDYLPTKKGDDNHAGEKKAFAASQEVGNAVYVLPMFSTERRTDPDDELLPKLTDFNDLHIAEGVEAVAQQLQKAIERLLSPQDYAVPAFPTPLPDDIGTAPAQQNGGAGGEGFTLDLMLARFALIIGERRVWDTLEQMVMKWPGFTALVGKPQAATWEARPDKRTIRQTDLPKIKRGKAVDDATLGASAMLMERYTLLYGTETVWDAENRIVLSLSAVRAAYGGDAVKFWQENPLRKMINAENLVFDPTQTVNLETHVNLFAGISLKPVFDEDLADPIIGLAMHLCNHDAKVYHWLMQWLALPLQKLGSKMDSSVLMFGEKQGTGKSLFFEGVIKAIYSEYATTIGQHQLDSQFTAWQSRRLFVLAEEVVGRAEKYSHIGTIKHLVTGRTVRINEKNMPEREEANYSNIVFLSNEVQPLHLELDDRRFMVIEPKTLLKESDQMEMKRALTNGAIAAFYGFLMKYPIDRLFDERSKPPMTAAKERLIEFGLSGWQIFYRHWVAGDLPVPYCSCRTEDLYAAFRKWRETEGGSDKLTQTKFSSLMSSRLKKSREHLSSGYDRKKAMVFIIGEPADGESLGSWLTIECARFAECLKNGFDKNVFDK